MLILSNMIVNDSNQFWPIPRKVPNRAKDINTWGKIVYTILEILFDLSKGFYIIWLVVSTPLKNISQLGLLFPIYGKKCSKPPTSNISIKHLETWEVVGWLLYCGVKMFSSTSLVVHRTRGIHIQGARICWACDFWGFFTQQMRIQLAPYWTGVWMGSGVDRV